jgi:hypothetical protein
MPQGSRGTQLAPGENAVVAVAASDWSQARLVFEYSTAPFKDTADLRPLVRKPSWLRQLVQRETRWSLDLLTGARIEVSTAHYRSIRGRSFALVVADELAYWPP